MAAFAIGDSQIVVADRGYNQLSYFGRDGNLVHTSGRPGDGPGEFRYIGYAWRCGDSLVVYDIQHRQYGVHTLDGAWVREYMPGAPEDSPGGQPYKTACGPDGTWISNGWEHLSPVSGAGLATRCDTGSRTGMAGSSPNSGSGRGPERLTGPNGSRPHPLGKEPVVAIGRTHAYIGIADSFAIMVFAFDGSPLPVIRKPSVELATTETDEERYRLLDTLGLDSAGAASEVRWWSRFEFPPTVPAYTAMLVDRDDNLWVRTFPRNAENVVRWVVFDDAGSEIGSIDLPATFTAYDIGSDWILGVETGSSTGASGCGCTASTRRQLGQNEGTPPHDALRCVPPGVEFSRRLCRRPRHDARPCDLAVRFDPAGRFWRQPRRYPRPGGPGCWRVRGGRLRGGCCR